MQKPKQSKDGKVELTYELTPYKGERSDFNYFQMVIKDDQNRKGSVSLAFHADAFNNQQVQEAVDATLEHCQANWEQYINANQVN